MKKENRIKKSEEFQRIMNKKQYASCPSMVLYLDRKQLEVSRFGISVSKKLGNAVERNKIKRQLRMMIQELDLINSDFDGILIARSNYVHQSYAENKKDLEMCSKKVRIK